MGRMAQIAESRGVAIHINEENFFSFANSPYYAHERISAVDVYPPRGELEALSPVEGPVLFVKPLSSGKDYALTIKVGEGLCVKILHVKPRVKTGEKVRVGDYLGKIVWSPFYNFWTDRHMHVEVRPIADPLRARGGFELDVSPLLAKMRLESLQASRGPRPFKVDLVKSEYALLKTPGGEAAFASPIAVKGGGFVGYVEGGCRITVTARSSGRSANRRARFPSPSSAGGPPWITLGGATYTSGAKGGGFASTGRSIKA